MIKKNQQYNIPPQVFDAYNKDMPVQIALGSERQSSKREQADIRSVNWVPGVSGWRITPRGIEFGNTSGSFPPGSITFADIQNISTNKLLGRSTAGTGSIEQLTIGTGLLLSGGTLSVTSSGHTIQDEGISLTTRTKLNFVGGGVTVTDDVANDATKVTIPSGGSGGTSSILRTLLLMGG